MLERPVVVAPVRMSWWRRANGSAMAIAATLVYLILALSLFWPNAPWSATTLPSSIESHGFGDPQQMTWFLAWIPYALSHGLSIFHSNYLDYPHGVDLANSTSVPLLGLIAAPFTLSLGPVAAFNILLRLAFASSATSMFLVLRTWCRAPAAFIGGLLYGFGPYMIVQSSNHLDLIFVPLLPPIVWCWYQLLFVRAHNPVKMGLLLGALCGAQALIDPELLAMLGILLSLGFIGICLIRPSQARARLRAFARAIPAGVAVFVALSAYYVWSLLFARGHLIGPVYPAALLQNFRSDLLDPIVPTTFQFIAPLALATTAFRFVVGNFSENAGYLSATFVILFAIFALRRRRDPVVVLSAGLALTAFVLSLGPSLEFDGHATSIPLPETVLSRITLFKNFVPARFSILVALFAVIAFCIGLDRFFAEAARHQMANLRTRLADMGVVALLLATAALMFPLAPLSTSTLPWSRGAASALATIPSGAVVLNYPFPLAPWTESMVWQAQDEMRFRLIGGYIENQASPTYGSSNPVLLKPKVVEETLLQAQEGRHSVQSYAPFYQQPNPKANVRRALCTFVARYHVGAVVFWKGGHFRGDDPSRIHRLFSADFGAPTHTGANTTLLIWIMSQSHCAP
jgi:hypothetical protein